MYLDFVLHFKECTSKLYVCLQVFICLKIWEVLIAVVLPNFIIVPLCQRVEESSKMKSVNIQLSNVCAVSLCHHLSPDSSLGLGQVNHERESAGVSRRAGDTTSRWKDVQGVESYCVGRFFSVKKSCSGERAFQPCVAKTEKFNLLEEIRAERSFCDICNRSRCGHL